jgi:membrane-associated PAP2 superfamily phosphatase
MTARRGARARHDLAVTLLWLLALLAWDASGADLALMHAVASAQGFAWRDAWWARGLLHDGGRLLAGAVLLGLVAAAWRAPARAAAPGTAGPCRGERVRWLAVTVLCLLAVPALKQLSLTSCPWDLAEFGGRAAYVPHWLPGVADGGPGRCFPSGHATAAFAFFGQFFLWREHSPRRARAWLLGVLLAGALFGGAQLLRGAHFASHTLWTAWLCWALAAAAAHNAGLARRRRSPPDDRAHRPHLEA